MGAFPIDHDLHTHTHLSLCSRDPEQNTMKLLTHAKENGYTVQCVTDHLWDADVPDPSGFYAPQDIAHVKQSLPLPQDDAVRFVFGCETEFCGGKKLGLSPAHYDDFDFIIIPPDHFHMVDFVRPASYDTEEKVADLLVERLEELTLFDLPWHKVGIAHLNTRLIFRDGDVCKVLRSMDTARLHNVFHKFAALGAGIELNMTAFGEPYDRDPEAHLNIYRIAKEEGCKFYLGTDAHHPDKLDLIPQLAPGVVEALGLTDEDLFRIPER